MCVWDQPRMKVPCWKSCHRYSKKFKPRSNYGEVMKRKNKPLLGIENARVLHAKLDWEGDMLYVAQNWTFKEEFKDKKYESLRKALVKAAADLDDYCALYRVDDEVEEDAP